MKALRATLALLMMLSPLVAEAKVMVVSPYANDTAGEVPGNNARILKLITNIFDLAGTDYTVVEMRNIKTEFIRSGQMVWNYGTAGAFAEQFDAVVHVNAAIGSSNPYGSTWSGYRLDSLMKGHKASEAIGTGTTKAPSKPQLVLSTNAYPLIIGDNSTVFVDGTGAGACTTGATGGGVTGVSRAAYLASDPSVRWINGTYAEAMILNSTPPAGGIRVHVGASIPNLEARETSNKADDVCRWCDSLVTPAAQDTVFVFERLMSHVTGAQPVVFAHMAGAGLSTDSLYEAAYNSTRPPAEGELAIAMTALARLDSICDGCVFPLTDGPIRVGLTIDGAFSYNDRMHHRGILKADSSTFDASMDSLATLGIPVTFGVNLDSVSANAEWKRWLAKVPKARFSPQNWTSLAGDTTVNSGAASFMHPVDIGGRIRKRAAFGDSSATGADTSMWALLRGGLYKCDSIWPGKASRFLMLPDDDWSPRGMNGRGTAPGVDSVLFAIARAGFVGVRVNSGDPDHSALYLTSNPKGWWNKQGWYSGSRGTNIKLLAYPGHGLAGAVHHFAHNDSAAPPDSGRTGMIYQEIHRAWLGATQKQDWNNDTWQYDGQFVPRVFDGVWLNQKDRVWREHYRGSIVRMSANDFSGDPNHPSRRGWWVVKSLAQNFKAINKLAGRTIIEFAYPEDINP